MYSRLCLALALGAFALSAQTVGKVDPTVQKIVNEISAEHVSADMQKLGSFETRGDYTDPNQPNRGIGAARRWIADQFRSYSPRLQVSFDSYDVKKQGRITRDVNIVNVVAVLPGTTQADKRVIISGHYDSVNLGRRATSGGPNAGPAGQPNPSAAVVPRGEGASTANADRDRLIDAPAPGVSDDASGTSAVLELARVMSQYQFEKTVVFVAFAGEELGLVGSSLYANKAKKENQQIEAVLNNDIIGNDVGGDGRKNSYQVNVYSDDPNDSSSRELARYIKDCAERYVPGFRVNLVFRADRFGRGGDHTPFNQLGYTAVRFTTPVENLQAQHSENDTFANASPTYTANVARVNAAALASLALAPPPPQVNRVPANGAAANARPQPNLSRGPKQYDALLRWQDPKPVEDLAGYAIVMRSTVAPFWEHQIFVGKVNEYTLAGVNIDEVVLGVKAINNAGDESLVSAYVIPPAVERPIELAGPQTQPE